MKYVLTNIDVDNKVVVWLAVVPLSVLVDANVYDAVYELKHDASDDVDDHACFSDHGDAVRNAYVVFDV